MIPNVSLENLINISHGIARHFGNDCEVCIHDLKSKDLEHTIIFIINGHVSNRKVGDGASKIVLKTIEDINKGKSFASHVGYRTHTVQGKILKSSTIFIKDETGNYRYLLGINFDITALVNMGSTINNLTSVEEEPNTKANDEIPINVQELLDNLIQQSVTLIGKAPALMTKDEKIRAIKFLKDSGAFLVTKSGDKISNFYGISKFTLYSYIEQSNAL